MRPESASVIRGLGLVLGLTLAAGVIVGGRMPEGQASTGATLTVESQPTATVGVSPAGRVLATRGLHPGRTVDAVVVLSNYTDRRLAVAVRARPRTRDLDRVAAIEISARGRRVAGGPLGALRGWSVRDLTLAAGQRVPVRIRSRIVRAAGPEHIGRSVTVDLQWSGRG